MPVQGLDFTFHRAFDMVRNQRQALDALISCGVSRVLTSGGAHTALQVIPAVTISQQILLEKPFRLLYTQGSFFHGGPSLT